MRCFIAIDLPEDVKKEIFSAGKRILSENIKAKAVEEENLHLTLRFLGEIDDSKINEIKEILKKIKYDNFEASLGNAGVFPSEDFIRVAWISLEPGEKFKELHKLIDIELEKIGIPKDERFESHITFARVKFADDKKKFIESLEKIKLKPLKFAIDSFSLKKSTLTREGSVYETIAEFKI